MKLIIFNFIFNLIPLLVSSADALNFREMLDLCRNETKVTQEEFLHVMRHEVPKTKAEECMLACYQKKMGFMDADNKFQLDKILQSIERLKIDHKDRYEILKKIFEDCKAAETVEKDQCTAAKKFAECVYPKENALTPPHTHRPPGHESHPPPFNRNMMEECKNKTGASNMEINNVMRHELPKTKPEQCMLACIQKKWGNIGQDNKIDLEKVKNRFRMIKEQNPNMYNRTIQMYIDCKVIETTEADECVAAKKYAECVFPKEKMNHLPPVMRRNVQECKNTTKATDAEIYTSVIAREIPKTKSESCMIACMQKKSGTMTADNTIAIQKIKNTFRNLKMHNEDLYDKSMKILDDCKAQETKETDECVAARKFAECIIPKEIELRKFTVRPRP